MSESFNFELKLVSDLDKVARRNAESLKTVQVQGQKAQKALDWGGALGKQFEKVGFASARAAQKQHQSFASSWSKIGMAADRAAKQQQKSFDRSIISHERAVERRTDKLRENSLGSGIKEGLGVGNLTKASFYGALMADGVMKAGEMLIEGAHKFVDVITEGIAHAFEAAGHEEKLGRQFKLSLGGKDGKESLEDADRFSKLTKFTPEQLAPMLLRLRRAGFDQKSARQTIATGSDIEAAGGLSTQEYAEFAEHLKLKGGVTTKQLVGAGINAPQFYKDLGKKLHVSAATAEKQAGEGGKIDTQLMLNMITAAVNKKQGGAAGTGGMAESTGFEARLAKLSALSDQYLKRLSDSPGFHHASEMLGHLLDNLDPESPTGQRIMSSLNGMFEKIVGYLGNPEDAADSLADKIEDAVGFAGELVDDFRSWADALLPSLETLEDMFFAMRKMKAIATGDEKGLASTLFDEAGVDKKRLSRGLEKQLRGQDKEMYQANLDDRLKRGDIAQQQGGIYGPVNMPAVEKAARADTDAQKNEIRKAAGVNIVVQPGAVVVHGAAGDEETHKQAGEGLHREVTRQLARAAQGGG